jgi:hypothetical protein
MSTKEKMVKDKRSSCGRDTTDGTRDGELSTLTNHLRFKARDTANNSVSTL